VTLRSHEPSWTLRLLVIDCGNEVGRWQLRCRVAEAAGAEDLLRAVAATR
jgi:hypothetical protein